MRGKTANLAPNLEAGQHGLEDGFSSGLEVGGTRWNAIQRSRIPAFFLSMMGRAAVALGKVLRFLGG